VVSQVKQKARIVLVGAGHAHVELLSRWTKRPPKDIDIVLVNNGQDFTYSAAMPAVIAGERPLREATISIRSIVAAAGGRFVNAEIIGIDRAAKKVRTANGQEVPYDVLSVNVGSVPQANVGGSLRAIPLKPWGTFLSWWTGFILQATSSGDQLSVAVVGAGASGVEVAMAMARRAENARIPLDVFLIEEHDRVVPELNATSAREIRRALKRHGITVQCGRRAAAVLDDDGGILLQDGRTLPVDAIVWTAGAHAPGFLKNAALAVDERGAVHCGRTLQTDTDPAIFVGGECAARGRPRRRYAGVQAIADGFLLSINLPRAARGNSLRARTPKLNWLSILSTGQDSAIADWGMFTFKGVGPARAKRKIDTEFLARIRGEDLDAQ
jgi:selenide, water dikinase